MGRKYLENLHPDFRPLAQELLVHIAHSSSLVGCGWYVASSWRDPDKQWELFKKGRKPVGADWVKDGSGKHVTNATPDKTPHCVTVDGKPASMAIDIALTERSGKGGWLFDTDPRWSIIGSAVALVNGQKLKPVLEWGGLWRSIRDLPHVEMRGWKTWGT